MSCSYQDPHPEKKPCHLGNSVKGIRHQREGEREREGESAAAIPCPAQQEAFPHPGFSFLQLWLFQNQQSAAKASAEGFPAFCFSLWKVDSPQALLEKSNQSLARSSSSSSGHNITTEVCLFVCLFVSQFSLLQFFGTHVSIFPTCHCPARGDLSTAVGSEEFSNWFPNCKWILRGTRTAQAAEINAGYHSPSCWSAGALSTFLCALHAIPVPYFQTLHRISWHLSDYTSLLLAASPVWIITIIWSSNGLS